MDELRVLLGYLISQNTSKASNPLIPPFTSLLDKLQLIDLVPSRSKLGSMDRGPGYENWNICRL